MRDLLGGKGANIAEMTRLGLPVPAGFTITTQACMSYLADNNFFDEYLKYDILLSLKKLEDKTGKSFLENEQLLLVSVRSGAKFSMPGMMDTILNLGLNDRRVQVFAQQTNTSFAYDCYRRLIQMFGDVVYGIPKETFDDLLEDLENNYGKPVEYFNENQHQAVIAAYQKNYFKYQKEFPQDPVEQLFAAAKAVFGSWNNQRAKVYRQLHDIAYNLGTAVNIQEMVFGNSGDHSA